jgi:DNA-binding response OmpR family regulator
LGKGTTFRVYLPEVDQPVDYSSPTPEKIMAVASNSATLLVVEDERAFRDLLHEGLQSSGFRVMVASNGVEALKVAEQYDGPIHVLITDVIMPQMSGPELAKCLTQARGNLNVLYISGYTDDKLGKIVESNGELTWIQKPFYINELVRKIQEILERKVGPSNRQPAGSQFPRAE